MSVPTITVNGTTYKLPFAAVMPPQTAEERERLKADIRANGIRVPVVVTEDDEVLDGHHRLTIAAELDLADIPREVKAGMTAAQKSEYAESVNLHRRHLSRDQVNAIIGRRLKADPAKSNRAIAGELGVDDKTVGAVRKGLESTAELPQLTATKGKDGKTRRKPKPAAAATESETTVPERPPPAPVTVRKVVKPLVFTSVQSCPGELLEAMRSRWNGAKVVARRRRNLTSEAAIAFARKLLAIAEGLMAFAPNLPADEGGGK